MKFENALILVTFLVLPWVLSCAPDERAETASGQRAGAAAPRFVDVTKEAGIDFMHVSGSPQSPWIIESICSGAGWLDYDGDGDQDLYIVNGSRFDISASEARPRNALYQNDAGRFVDVTDAAGVGDTGWGIGCAVADINNDGSPDIYVTNYGANVLYLNNGDGTFSDMSDQAGVADPRMSASSAFGDFNGDGFVDLYVANYVRFDPEHPPNGGQPCHWYGIPVYCGPEGLIPEADALFRNNGNGTFTDVSGSSGIARKKAYGLGVVFGDYDNDGDADIYIANDSMANFLFRNNGEGTFTDVGVSRGVAYSETGEEQAGMGVDFGDYDNDGDQDLIVTNFSDDYNTVYRNGGNSFFSDATAGARLRSTSYFTLGWGANFCDFDNDGYLDLFIANGHVFPQADNENSNTSYRQKNKVFINDRRGGFTDASARLGAGLAIVEASRGIALCDYDADGDVDVFIVNEKSAPNLLRNDGGNRNHWLRVALQGRESNRDALGAQIELRAGGVKQFREVRRSSGYASSQEGIVHFGLGRATTVDSLLVRWPSGRSQSFRDIKINTEITLVEGEANYLVRAQNPQ